MPPGVYLAGPLGFSEATRAYHERLKAEVESLGWEALDPWAVSPEDLAVLTAPIGSPARKQLLAVDRKLGANNALMIEASTAVLAILDGADVDSGTAAEIGYAAAKGKRIIGLRLDIRNAGDNEAVTVNLQVEHFIVTSGGAITRTLEAALAALGRP
jgi:nucleoside 2-deoxyribosyltransferase